MSKKVKNIHDKKHLTRRTLREWGWGYVFIAPWIVGVCIFFLYAMFQSLQFAFHRVELSGGVILHPLEKGIFENFVKVFTTDVNFPTTLANFGIGLVLQLPVIIAFSLIIALLLNSKIRCRGLFRLIFFLPVIIATGPVMNQMMSQGVASVPMVSQNAMLGMLEGLPEFIYEAATIDGASGWETFWKITLPSVKSLILLNSIYTVVTLATGGTNEIIELIYTATYTATQGYSYAMDMSWIYTAVVAVILVIVFLLLKEKSDRKVVYEQKRVDMKGV